MRETVFALDLDRAGASSCAQLDGEYEHTELVSRITPKNHHRETSGGSRKVTSPREGNLRATDR